MTVAPFPTSVFLGRGARAREVPVGKLLGEGAAGRVFALEGMPGAAAKLYHDAAQSKAHEAKIEAMIAGPPDLPPATHLGQRYPQIAWPQDKLYDRAGKFIGFTMPMIDFGRSTSLVNLLQKSSRRIEKLSDYYGYRVLVARNLASVFAELHRAGHHMIDMKPANLRFYPQVSWMAVVDTDGFSIAGKNGRIPADVVSDEYIAPESWKRPVKELAEQQDLFALAVIIFQLLNNGVHPFAGAKGAGGEATDLQARIVDGLYPYALRPRAGSNPSAASLHRMFRRGTRVMFDCAFVPGDRRPTAQEWREHLDTLLTQLTPCAAKPGEHVHFGAGCGFCGHEARVAASTARPAVAPVRKIVKAKPATRGGTQVAHRSTSPVRAHPPMRHRVPIRRKRQSGVGGMMIASALMLAAVATQGIWYPMLRGDGAVTTAGVSSIPPLDVDSVEKVSDITDARDYLVVPADGALTVPLRSGPGANFGEVDHLNLHDPVTGRGVSADTRGGEWVWVRRTTDGVSGYVQQAALLQRGQERAPGAVTPAELARGERAINTRYRALLARSEGSSRSYLIEGQKLWEAQRRRCDDDPDPSQCRKLLDARRLGDLTDWRAAEMSRRDDPPPRLTTISSSEDF